MAGQQARLERAVNAPASPWVVFSGHCTRAAGPLSSGYLQRGPPGYAPGGGSPRRVGAPREWMQMDRGARCHPEPEAVRGTSDCPDPAMPVDKGPQM